MEKWGQKRALEKNGDDLTHYTDMFGDAIVAAIFKGVINNTNHHLDEGRQRNRTKYVRLPYRSLSSLQMATLLLHHNNFLPH